jgi:hypothetical protein
MKIAWNWKRWPFAAAAFALAAVPALAHEKWFATLDASLSRPVFTLVSHAFAATIILLGAVGFVLAAWFDRRFDGSRLSRWFDAKLAAFTCHPRTVLGVAIGVSLMGAGLKGTLFSPNLVLGGDMWSMALGMIEIGIGSLFLFLEPAYPELGLLLILLFLAGLPVLPFWDLMEEAFMVGAGILFMTGPAGRPGVREPSPETTRRGYQAFRIIMGISFLVLSSVKWLHPELALQVVAEYQINFMAPLGASAAQFVFVSAVIETLIGLAILLRVAFRPAVAVAFGFFLISILFLGFQELLGHLPVKAALFMLFLYGHWHKGDRKT